MRWQVGKGLNQEKQKLGGGLESTIGDGGEDGKRFGSSMDERSGVSVVVGNNQIDNKVSGASREDVGMLESQTPDVWFGVESTTTCGEYSTNHTSFERIAQLVIGSKHQKPLV